MPDRKTHWDNIYKDKAAQEVSWYQNEPAVSLQLIHNTKVASDAPMLDVGGGLSLLVDHLSAEGYSRVGVLDISVNAINSCRQRLAEKSAQIEWYAEDIMEFDPSHSFAVWHDRAVFHFLTEPGDREKYIGVLKRILKPGGHLIMAAFALDGPTKCSGLDVIRYDAAKLKAELGDEFQLLEQCSELHLTPSALTQSFNYFRFIRAA